MKAALPPLISADSEILILGTMPGEKSILSQQYYANKGNQFWKILFTVFDEPFSPDYEVRKNLLQKHKIALWNTLAYCEREGSADHKIRNERPNDFAEFFSKYPNIRYVFFESLAAVRFYHKYAVQKDGIIYDTLPSVSGLNAKMSFADKIEQWRKVAGIQHFGNI